VILAMAEADLRLAEELLDLWSRFAMQHVALGTACACGMGGISLRLEDFELDIVDYLADHAERCEVAEIAAFFAERMAAEPVAQPLKSLLEEAREARLPEAVAGWMLPRVEKTLKSFAALHGGGA
jgi:hypothetical protein